MLGDKTNFYGKTCFTGGIIHVVRRQTSQGFNLGDICDGVVMINVDLSNPVHES